MAEKANPNERTLRRPEVEIMVGLSRSTIYDMLAREEFPVKAAPPILPEICQLFRSTRTTLIRAINVSGDLQNVQKRIRDTGGHWPGYIVES